MSFFFQNLSMKCNLLVIKQFTQTFLTHFLISTIFRKANEKILVRVQNDLFIQMPYKRALQFVAKRLEFLNQIASDYLKDIAQIKAHITMTYAVLCWVVFLVSILSTYSFNKFCFIIFSVVVTFFLFDNFCVHQTTPVDFFLIRVFSLLINISIE